MGHVSVAADEAKENPNKTSQFIDTVREELLRDNNLRRVQYLPGVLPLYTGMRLLLNAKDCVRLELMNGCEVTLEHIFLAEAEDDHMPNYAALGTPIFLHYMPECLLLRADAECTLPRSKLPSFADEHYNRKGLFPLFPETRYARPLYIGHRRHPPGLLAGRLPSSSEPPGPSVMDPRIWVPLAST